MPEKKAKDTDFHLTGVLQKVEIRNKGYVTI